MIIFLIYYNIDRIMNNYNELEYDKVYNPSDLSSKISCANMSLLSKDYTIRQKMISEKAIDYELCESYGNYFDNICDIKNTENDLLTGMSIGKKSCIYKKPEYQEGEWVYQYGISDTFKNQLNSYELFNFQSKAKTTKKVNHKCKQDFQLLGECKKGPFNTYVNTFTTDEDNCI
jgi:hypothetical protein